MTTIERIIESVDSLPPWPATVQRLLAVIDDPRSDAEDIVEAVRHDPAITGQILRVCNSSATGLSRKVGSLQQGVAYLGTSRIAEMAVASQSRAVLSRCQNGYGLDAGELWRHSIGVAFGSSAVAERLGMTDRHLLFTAGLLHDIGKVVLNEHVAEAYTEILGLVTRENLSFVEAEQRILGFSHDRIGALVADKWQLPPCILSCIRHHHDPEALDIPDPNVDAVYIANVVCLLLGIGLGADGLSCRADRAVMERHRLVERDLELIGLQVLSGLESVEHLLIEPAEPRAGTRS